MKLSLIRNQITKKIKVLENDKILLEKEVAILKNQVLNNKKSPYSEYRVIISNLYTSESMVTYVESQIDALKEGFSDDIIDDLDYTLKNHKTYYYDIVADLIIEARKDIYLFLNSDLNNKHYEKQVKQIEEKQLYIQKYSFVHITLNIPKKPYKILQELVLYLNFSHFKNRNAIKEIITTISDARITPRNMKQYKEDYYINILGTTREKFIENIVNNCDITSPKERVKYMDLFEVLL